MMRAVVGVAGILVTSLVTGLASGEEATAPASAAKPRVYALIAAVGNQFTEVTEVSRTGTNLSPYRHKPSDGPDNILNRLVLHALDKSISTVDPDSKRLYMFLPPAPMLGVAPSQREGVAIESVVTELEHMPQRLDWDRIVVATPVYQGLARDGMPSHIDGLGIFLESQCQAGCGVSLTNIPGIPNPDPPDGVPAVTSEDKPIRARTYIAPFSYIEIWVLDPKTLAILDKQQSMDSQKLAEPAYKPRMNPDDFEKYLAKRIVSTVELSVDDAVRHSEVLLRKGEVRVGPVNEVPGDDAKK